jgi:ubiquinone/menaquinone biosynthesis C-methylase UbiE
MSEDQASIDAIRSSYDRVADAYAEAIFGELKNKPFDCDLLTRFAATTAGRGPVCDLGCGPGQVARFLREAGVDVFGVDLSAGMIEQARRLNEGIEFRTGNMLALEVEDASLAGIAAFYSIVNLPADARQQAFREMARVLQAGGLLLLTFHIEGPVPGVKELFGRPITMDFYMLDRAVIESELRDAGLEMVEGLERGPYPPPIEHQSRRAYLFARKPAA